MDFKKEFEKHLGPSKKMGSGEKMSEMELQAKIDVLQELFQMAQETLGSKVKGDMDEMQKVSVMAPDTESLEEGLGTAQAMLAGDAPAAPEDKLTDEDDFSAALPSGDDEEDESDDEEDDEEDDDAQAMASEKPKRKLFSMDDDEDEA